MKVAVVADLIRANGAGVMARTAATLLTDAGHDVLLIAGALDPKLATDLRASLVEAAYFTQDLAALNGSVTELDHQSFRRSFRFWFDDQIDSFAPDVLYVHNCGRLFDQLDLAELSRSVPLAHAMHDEWFFTDAHYTFETDDGLVERTYEPRDGEDHLAHRYEHLFEVPDAMGAFVGIGPSQWITERAQRVFPMLEFVNIPNAVDPYSFSLQDRGAAREVLGIPQEWPVVMFVGNPTQARKNFAVVEMACRAVRVETGTDPVRLVVGGAGSVATNGAGVQLGAGPLLEQLRRPTSNPLRDLGIEGPAVVLGDLNHALMPTIYGAANVLVHPSRIDNFPTVPIEAGLCGTRCLATDVGGTRETIADTRDLLPSGCSATELGSRIAVAIEQSATETAHERLARRQSQLDRFTAANHVEALTSTLRSIALKRTDGEGADG